MTSTAPIFLHAGTMKTGTSYLQQVLRRNEGPLAADGGIFANDDRRTKGAVQEAIAAREGDSLDGPWSRLVALAHGHDGDRVIISNELMSLLSDDGARRVVESLAPSNLTVMITARDLARLLPSAWQNKIKHGRAWTFSSYVDSVINGDDDDPKGAARSFWHHHDIAAIVRRWADLVGTDNVVVIPVPGREAGPDALWHRFASVNGLTAEAYDLTQDRKSNLSLGYTETELLRQVNRRLRGEANTERYQKLVLRVLANEVLRPDPSRPASSLKPQLQAAQHAWAVERSRELADAVVASGVRIEGSVDDLVPTPMTEAEAEAAEHAAAPEIPELFVDVVVKLLQRLVRAEGMAAAGGLDADDDEDLDDHTAAPERGRGRGAGRGGKGGGKGRGGRSRRAAIDGEENAS